MRIISALAVLLFSFSGLGAQNNVSRLRIVFAGDIMGHDTQIAAAKADSEDTYDYTSCFRYLKSYLENADIALGNLELTLAGPPYKGYPQFSSPDELGDALMESGFNVLVNANNHALDRGREGLERTIDVVNEKGMIMTGSFKTPGDRELKYPLILEKNNIRLALLNYTYGTNGLVVDTPNLINYLDTIQISQDIRKARLVDPDIIIACVHWGTEYQREENTVQRELAGYMFSQGVNAIIGSHPHVVQPVAFREDGAYIWQPVFYSLGNFISNQRDRYRNGGIFAGLEFEKSDSTRITRIEYLPVYVHKPNINGKNTFELIPAGMNVAELEAIGFSEEDRRAYNEFSQDTREHLANISPATLPPVPGNGVEVTHEQAQHTQ